MRCDTHPILNHTALWAALEQALSGWLHQQNDPDMRRLCSDGFVPEFVNRRKLHIEVEGYIWWMGSVTKDWRFLAFIPNRIAEDPNPDFALSEVVADAQSGFVTIRIAEAEVP